MRNSGRSWVRYTSKRDGVWLDGGRYPELDHPEPFRPDPGWVCMTPSKRTHLRNDGRPIDAHLEGPLDAKSDLRRLQYGALAVREPWLALLRAAAPEADLRLGRLFFSGDVIEEWRSLRPHRAMPSRAHGNDHVTVCPHCGWAFAVLRNQGSHFRAKAPFDDPVIVNDYGLFVRADLVDAAELPTPRRCWPLEKVPLLIED